jgi:ATP/maltotriose-dependent transcriptional regulator MalT
MKCSMPPLRPDLVPRPGLFARLDAGLTCKLLLVSAPAGFGKTSLVSAWLQQRNLLAAWLALDAGDNDPARLLLYLVTALQQLDPALGRTIPNLLQASPGLPLESMLGTLINDLATRTAPTMLAPEGYVRLFLDEGAWVPPLLVQGLANGDWELATACYARRLRDAFAPANTGPHAPLPGSHPRLVEPLTGREAQILRLLAAGHNSTQIADQLVVAPSTVRSHIKSLYGKLDVHSRHEALSQARALELIP